MDTYKICVLSLLVLCIFSDINAVLTSKSCGAYDAEYELYKTLASRVKTGPRPMYRDGWFYCFAKKHEPKKLSRVFVSQAYACSPDRPPKALLDEFVRKMYEQHKLLEGVVPLLSLPEGRSNQLIKHSIGSLDSYIFQHIRDVFGQHKQLLDTLLFATLQSNYLIRLVSLKNLLLQLHDQTVFYYCLTHVDESFLGQCTESLLTDTEDSKFCLKAMLLLITVLYKVTRLHLEKLPAYLHNDAKASDRDRAVILESILSLIRPLKRGIKRLFPYINARYKILMGDAISVFSVQMLAPYITQDNEPEFVYNLARVLVFRAYKQIIWYAKDRFKLGIVAIADRSTDAADIQVHIADVCSGNMSLCLYNKKVSNAIVASRLKRELSLRKHGNEGETYSSPFIYPSDLVRALSCRDLYAAYVAHKKLFKSKLRECLRTELGKQRKSNEFEDVCDIVWSYI